MYAVSSGCPLPRTSHGLPLVDMFSRQPLGQMWCNGGPLTHPQRATACTNGHRCTAISTHRRNLPTAPLAP
eukprot:3666111-Lingulodinium_polyedra.AAC.1